MFSHIKELFTRPSGYTIAKSVRVRSSASAYFNRTLGSGNAQKFTLSMWCKLSQNNAGGFLFDAYSSGTVRSLFQLDNSTGTTIQFYSGNGTVTQYFTTNQVFRDPSAWYHLVFKVDTTASTNGIVLYVNGVATSLTWNNTLAQNTNLIFNTAVAHNIGKYGGGAAYFDGYLTEINFIDGQALTPSSFGETDSITGVWKAKKYSGTYGTNGFYLNFSDNSSNTATTIGKDYSGNGNNWTPNNISVTAGVTYDSMVDSPTVSALSSNYCVLNPLEKYSGLTVADGNLKVTSSDNTQYGAAGTLAVSSGKWYYEAMFSNASVNNMAMGLTTTQNNVQTAQWAGSTGMFMCGNFVTGTAIHVGVNGSYTQVSTTLPSAGSYLVCALDYDNGKAWFGTTTSSGGAVTWYPASTGGSVGDPAAGTNPTITFSTTYPIRPFMGSYSAGLNWIANFGQRPFITTAPSGFNAWNTYNLPASTIKNGAAYMAATTYTGTGSAQNITNSGSFQPDFVWIKNRGGAYGHGLVDSVRGRASVLYSNDTAAQGTSGSTQDVTAFNSNGFALGTNSQIECNASGQSYIGWQWKAGGTSSSNTNGSITSTVSVGATQGFSVVTYTGTGANATVGHGLGVAPSMIIIKNRSAVGNWIVYHSSVGATQNLFLNTTAGSTTDATAFNNTAPTSSVFSIGTSSALNGSTNAIVAYCFSSVAGFSKFGSYVGNGSTDGPFIFTGFRPRFVMIKSTSGDNWTIVDTSRNTYNVADARLFPSTSGAEATGTANCDILSNGFKIRIGSTDTGANGNGTTYVYAAFAEIDFKTSLAR